MPDFERVEAESVRRYALQIGSQMRKPRVSKLLVARAVVSLLEAAFGYCGEDLAAEFARRMVRARRIGRGFCMACGANKVQHSPFICGACDDKDFS